MVGSKGPAGESAGGLAPGWADNRCRLGPYQALPKWPQHQGAGSTSLMPSTLSCCSDLWPWVTVSKYSCLPSHPTRDSHPVLLTLGWPGLGAQRKMNTNQAPPHRYWAGLDAGGQCPGLGQTPDQLNNLIIRGMKAQGLGDTARRGHLPLPLESLGTQQQSTTSNPM